MADNSQGVVESPKIWKPGTERRAAILAFAYFFCLMSAYFVLRPVRDEMAVRSGVTSLPSLFLGTFIASVLLTPVFGALVAQLRRSWFIGVVYGFLLLNILMFWWSWTAGVALGFTTRAFFIWLSVFNVFAVSVFWSFMADIFRSEQARRLYPMIAAGGSLGGVAGAGAVTALAAALQASGLLIVAAVLLAMAMAFALTLERVAGAPDTPAAKAGERKVGGTWLSGFRTVVSSFYVGGIALWVVLLSVAGTFLYAMQTDVVGRAGLTSEARVQLFGMIDLICNIMIPVLQFTLARLILSKAPVGLSLGAVCAVFASGFVVLAFQPSLAIVVVLMVAQRTTQFAFSNPALQALWNLTPREDKYKAKNVIDVPVFRGADVASASVFKSLQTGLGLGLSTLAWIAAPIAVVWAILSLMLGRRHDALLARQTTSEPQGS